MLTTLQSRTEPERIYNPITAMGFSAMFTFQLHNTKRKTLPATLLIAEILSGKNVRARVSMDFTQDKFSAPIAIEKIKILGAPWELLAK